MATPLRVLILEDVPADAELMIHELRRSGFDPDWQRVAGEKEYLAHLDETWDVILADYNLPGFDAPRALIDLHERGLDIPFIVVTGMVGEEEAVECMKRGAADYLLKDRLARLGEAVRHALNCKRMNEARRESEAQLRVRTTALAAAANSVVITDREGTIVWINPAFTRLTGYTTEEALGQNPRMLKSGHQDSSFYKNMWDTILSGKDWRGEIVNRRKDGTLYTAELTITPVRGEGGQISHFIAIEQDITERKRSEQRIQRQLEQISALRTIDMAITSSLDVRVTLNVLLDEVTAQLGVDAAAVLLLNRHTQMLEYAAARGFRTGALRHTQLRLGEGHAGRAAVEREIIAVPDLASEPGDFERAPLLRNEQFVAYYAAPLVAKGSVQGVMEIFHRKPLEPDQEWLDILEALAGQAAIAVDNATLFDALQRSNMELIRAYDATLEGWSRALDLRDKETEGHTQRVTEMTVRLARIMGMSEAELVHVRRGALLHDIGKMGIPDSVLHKPGPLNEQEWEIMRKHPTYAYELLSPIAFLRRALDIPYCHHEKWDGSGYPRKLKGEQIPLAARVFAAVDVWDALRSDRPYRPAWPEDRVIQHIRSQAGMHFDPNVAEAFLEVLARGDHQRPRRDALIERSDELVLGLQTGISPSSGSLRIVDRV